ncbi:Hypothetical predicted protein [Olea europaea subsp. europaea]|uniref:Bulb-type lectin domain-containing protein n=1 Tax=Olea europaea subsp. europaea TaxID=158383 RepID=A0A8S0U7J0_OLEEU|nr:Hypothetical predicted protein [Olea europaea subsp. europaea]
MSCTVGKLSILGCACVTTPGCPVDTLKQGDRLNSSAYLVSAYEVFTLGFYSLENTNNSYLGVWFTDDSYGPVWLGNRDKPIADNSGVLTISSIKKLIINSSGGDPIELTALIIPLIIRQRGVANWTSGELKDYIDEDRPELKLKKFKNIGGGYDPCNFIYNFVNVTNGGENYMSYFLEIDPVLTPDELKISGWKLDSEGFIFDHRRMVIANVRRCYGYNTREGCELWEQLKCRNYKETFDLGSGHFMPTSDSYSVYDNSSSLTESTAEVILYYYTYL